MILNTIQDSSVETFWIGLTKEVPTVAGLWMWVYPGDNSTIYSNWEEGKVTSSQKIKNILFRPTFFTISN